MEFETPSQFHALKRSINVVASLTIILLRILLLSIHLTDNLYGGYLRIKPYKHYRVSKIYI